MIDTCVVCGKTFTAKHNQKHCPDCLNYKVRVSKRLAKQLWFEREWANWNHDFKRGRTISNL